MTMTEVETDQPTKEPVRIGLLTVHGMGQQQRFQQLAEMTWALLGEWHIRGLLSFLWQQAHQSFLSALEGVYRTEPYTHRGFVDRKVVLDLGSTERGTRTEKAAERRIELHIMELYWAPMSRCCLSVLQILIWIGRSVLAPLKNYTAMKRTADHREYPRYIGLVILYLLIVLFLAVLLLSMAWIAWQTYHISAWCGNGGLVLERFFMVNVENANGLLFDLADVVRRGRWLAALQGALAVTCCLLISSGAYILGVALNRELRGPRRIRRILQFSAALLASGAVGYTTLRLAIMLRWWPLFALVLLIVLWHLIRTALVDFMGDVMIYAQSNEVSGTYPIRRKITRYAVERLEYLTGIDVQIRPEGKPGNDGIVYDSPRPDFDALILAGHSLGSVVLYDALDFYISRLQELDAENGTNYAIDFADKLKLYLTYGSPLDKMRYFFSAQRNGNPVFDDLRRGGRLMCKDVMEPGDLFHTARWINLWCFTDIVSGPLDDYGHGVENLHVPGLWAWPVFNHNMYLQHSWVQDLLDREIRRAASEVIADGR